MNMVSVQRGTLLIRTGEDSAAAFGVGDAEALLRELPAAIAEAREFLVRRAEQKLAEAQTELARLAAPPPAAVALPRVCPDCGGRTDGHSRHPDPAGGECDSVKGRRGWRKLGDYDG